MPPPSADDSPERYRGYLRTLARLLTADPLVGKLDLSAVVQQTLLEAGAAADRWADWSPAQRAGWLRSALAHNLTDAVRHATAACRDVTREVSVERSLAESSARAEAWLAAEQSSPGERADRNEQLVRLADALAELPADQRAAVEWHHLAGLTVAQTAAEMGKTPQAVVGLLFRGLRRLRGRMGG